MYKCSKCGIAVIIIPNENPIRACNCKASIIVDMGTAKLTGNGNVKTK
jgi:DNA-directed RNA polymerase subunit RPC12/RpoP